MQILFIPLITRTIYVKTEEYVSLDDAKIFDLCTFRCQHFELNYFCYDYNVRNDFSFKPLFC